MEKQISHGIFDKILYNDSPSAIAWIIGSEETPNLSGQVNFFETPLGGVVVNAEIFGLPDSGFFGMHIHENGNCIPPFDKTGNHYNPKNAPHPEHAGDLPPLIGNNGYAWTAFYDDRFTVKEIVQKSVVIHAMRDDFTNQPSGDSGEKIGCGVIVKFENNTFW